VIGEQTNLGGSVNKSSQGRKSTASKGCQGTHDRIVGRFRKELVKEKRSQGKVRKGFSSPGNERKRKKYPCVKSTKAKNLRGSRS